MGHPHRQLCAVRPTAWLLPFLIPLLAVSAHQHLVFFGTHFKDVSSLKVLVQMFDDKLYDPNALTADKEGWQDFTSLIRGDIVHFTLAVHRFDHVTVRITTKDDPPMEVRQEMPDVRSEQTKGSGKFGEWQFGKGAPCLHSFTSNIRHLELWTRFTKKLERERANFKNSAEAKETMFKAHDEALLEERGWQVLVLMDHVPERLRDEEAVIRLLYTPGGKYARKLIQKQGTVFAAWSVQKEVGSLEITIGRNSRMTRQTANKVKFTDVAPGFAKKQLEFGGQVMNVYLLVFSVHGEMDAAWRYIELWRHRPDHPYWDKAQKAWIGEAIEKLSEDVREKVIKVNAFGVPFDTHKDVVSQDVHDEKKAAGRAPEGMMMWQVVLLVAVVGVCVGMALYCCCVPEMVVHDSSEEEPEDDGSEFMDAPAVHGVSWPMECVGLPMDDDGGDVVSRLPNAETRMLELPSHAEIRMLELPLKNI